MLYIEEITGWQIKSILGSLIRRCKFLEKKYPEVNEIMETLMVIDAALNLRRMDDINEINHNRKKP